MNSSDQMWVILGFTAALFGAAYFTSDTELVLRKINKVQAERILRQEVYVDTLINWVEEAWEIKRTLKKDSLNLKQALKKIEPNINLQYRNLNLYLLKYPPNWTRYDWEVSKRFLLML